MKLSDGLLRNKIGPSRRAAMGLIAGGVASAWDLPRALSRDAADARLVTVEPGALTIAMTGDMPMTNVRGDEIIGIAGEMISAISTKLGLKPRPMLMEFSATIEAIRGGRADVLVGNVGWTPARAGVMLLTDVAHYAGKYALMRSDQKIGDRVTIDDFKGLTLGTVTGFTGVPEMKLVPGITGIKLYDNSDACVRDIRAGRLDFGFLDTPTTAYMVSKNPDWGLKLVKVTPLPGFKVFSQKQLSVYGMNGQNTDLYDAVNQGVRWLWSSGLNAKILANYGMSDNDYVTAVDPDPRVGVDRDRDGRLVGKFAHAEKDYSALFG